MNRAFSCLLATSALLLGSATALAASIGTLTCGGSQGATANLSFYQLGSSQIYAGASSGSGAGKVTLLPLTVHAALSQFQNFYAPYLKGQVFPSCILTSSAAGQTFSIELVDAEITSFSATAANNATAAGGEDLSSAYIEFTISYQSIKVEAKGADDGGTSPPVITK